LSEIPGIGLAIVLVDRAGRRMTQSVALGGFGLGLLIIAASNLGRAGDMILLFFARALANTAYSVTWIYTPEVFPTSLRTTAFALAECCAHVGSMITPFVAQTMLDLGYLNAAASIFCVMAWMGVVATNFLKVETAGAAMAEEDAAPDAGSKRVEMTVI
jgi:putative MFS transporter